MPSEGLGLVLSDLARCQRILTPCLVEWVTYLLVLCTANTFRARGASITDSEVLLATAILGLAIVLILFTASIRIVRETERLVPFRLGRVMAAHGPGLVLVVPIIDRTVRVDVPVHFVQTRERSPYARGEALTPRDDQLPGHPGLTVSEVSVRAAMIAAQRNPRTKRATTEDFLAALEELDRGKGRGF